MAEKAQLAAVSALSHGFASCLLTGNQAISFFSSFEDKWSGISTEPLCYGHPGFFFSPGLRGARRAVMEWWFDLRRRENEVSDTTCSGVLTPWRLE